MQAEVVDTPRADAVGPRHSDRRPTLDSVFLAQRGPPTEIHEAPSYKRHRPHQPRVRPSEYALRQTGSECPAAGQGPSTSACSALSAIGTTHGRPQEERRIAETARPCTSQAHAVH